MSGIAHLNNHSELYIESISRNNWANYVQQISNPGTWCDNIIVQAVANEPSDGLRWFAKRNETKRNGTLRNGTLRND